MSLVRGLTGEKLLAAVLVCLLTLSLFGTAFPALAANGASETERASGTEASGELDCERVEDIRAKAEEAVKAAAHAGDEVKLEADKAAAQKQKDAAELAQNDPLQDIWVGQRALIDSVIGQASDLTETFLSDITVLDEISPVENDISRQLLLMSEYKQYPGLLESVDRRLSISVDLVDTLILKAAASQYSAMQMLNQLESSADSMTELGISHGEETAEYLDKINIGRFLVTAVIARYDSALAPARALVERVDQTRQEMATLLPSLWKGVYMQEPTAWLSTEVWSSLKDSLSKLPIEWSLRKAVELPLTTAQWQGVVTRFILTLAVAGFLGLLLAKKLEAESPEIGKHLRGRTIPLNVLGVAFIAASSPSSTELFRFFVAVGNLCLIVGQVMLAWELRRIKFPETTRVGSPLFAIMPLTIAAYVFLYLSLPATLTLGLWMICLIIGIVICHKTKIPDLGKMRLEKSILELQPVALWPCLILALIGMHIYSMALYLLYSSICVGVQICVASMSFLSRLNEALDDEGSSTMWLSFLVAISAPVVLMLSCCVVSLWIVTLPGGMDLLQFYIFKSVSIGETQLNFMQVLLIATAFFLARTAARMGKNFIAKLPERGVQIDRSLITPMQTGYFYLVWCLFGFFVLKSLGMNLSNLAVIAGGLSVGIGFGMQTIVNNFISGIILIFSRNLQVGDVVEVGGVVGRIKQINVRATVVETYDSAVIYVPNSAFVSGNLTNWTSNSRSTRTSIMVGVAYDSDTEKVSKIMLEVARKRDDVLAYPQPSVSFKAFGVHSLEFQLYFWVRDYDLASGVSSEIRYAINKRFKEEGIALAYKFMDVNDVYLTHRTATGKAGSGKTSRRAVGGRKTRLSPRFRRTRAEAANAGKSA